MLPCTEHEAASSTPGRWGLSLLWHLTCLHAYMHLHACSLCWTPTRSSTLEATALCSRSLAST